MSVVAELRIESSNFALGQTLQAVPGIEVEFERVVTHSQEWVMPFLWATGAELDAFEREISSDGTVTEFRVIDRFDNADLYQIKWSKDVRTLVNGIFDQSGVLVEGTGSAEAWDIVVQFDEQQSLARIEESFNDGKSAFTLERLYTPETPRQVEFNLTSAQRDTLVMAIERGFFDIPRETTLEALGDEFGVTSSAVSERLRRAIETLGTNALSIDDEIE